MKTQITIIIALLISITSIAQNGINYKAIVKDGSSNVITNQQIQIQFSILQGVAQTNVYSETHAPTTDANGLVILNIGEGTPVSGDFTTVDWGSDDHYLNVQLNIEGAGGSFVDLGTTQFMAVPYALNAANVSGLEAIDEGNGIGWRLKGNTGGGTIGDGAIDLGNSNTASGIESVVMGTGNEALGTRSTVMGFANSASDGSHSLVGGIGNTASGGGNVLFGANNTASGSGAAGFGNILNIDSFFGFAIGRGNVGGGNPVDWIGSDPLFEIGNGTSTTNRSNALTVLKNGTITAPSFDLSEITDDKALVTKEYADTNLVNSGLEAIDEGNGIGWRLKGVDPANYGNIGLNAVDLSYGDVTTSGATGNYSTALGANTFASGEYSTAMGYGTTASGSSTVAMGFFNIDNPNALLSVGNGNLISGASNALTILQNGKHIIDSSGDGIEIDNPGGDGIKILSPDNDGVLITSPIDDGLQVNDAGNNAVDIFNAGNNGINVASAGNFGGFFKGTNAGIRAQASIDTNQDIILGSTNGYISSDPDVTGSDVFMYSNDDMFLRIGNSSSNFGQFAIQNGDAENQMIVNENGNILLGSTATNNAKVTIYGDDDADLIDINSGAFQIGSSGGPNILMDRNEIMARNVTSSATLFLQQQGGAVAVGGSVVHSSDRRLKKDIEELPYGLNEILQLQPKAYNWKDRDQDHKSLGLIAQDVQPIISEIVNERDDEEKTLGVSYTELIPVLIKAIKEQQDIIIGQNQKIESLTENNSEKDKALSNIYSRLTQIEKELAEAEKMN